MRLGVRHRREPFQNSEFAANGQIAHPGANRCGAFGCGCCSVRLTPVQRRQNRSVFQAVSGIEIAHSLSSLAQDSPFPTSPAPPSVQLGLANCEHFYKLTAAIDLLSQLQPLPQGRTPPRRRVLAMQPNSQERRLMRRFDMRLPALVKFEGSTELFTETQNVSARGVFFYVDRSVAAGTKLEVTLTFPPHVTLTDAVRVRFSARVIRVDEPLPSARIGVAAMIENYEFLRSGGSPDFFTALQDEWKKTH